MSKLVRLLLACAALLVLTTPAFAQGNFFYRDDANLLDQAKVQQAAQTLVQKGAQVAVYTASSGGSASTFQQYLIKDGLARSDGTVPNNLIAIFIGLNPNYSSIRYGNNYSNALGTNERYETIRQNQLNSGLRNNDATGGVTDALNAINSAVGSSSGSSSGTTTSPTTSTGGGFGFLPWCLGILALAIGGPFLYRMVTKGQASGKARATAQQAFEQARKAAGAAIADALPIFQDAREKAQYDRVSYPAEDVAQITAQQQQAEQAYRTIQEQYAATEESFKAKQNPAANDYELATEAYNQITSAVAEARALLEPANARRAELDRINASAPEAISKAKQTLQQLVNEAENVGLFSDPAAVGKPVASQIAQAEAQLNARHGGEAAKLADAAAASVAPLLALVQQFASIREGISEGRAATEQARGQFNIDAGLQAFDRAEATLHQAAEAFQTQGSEAATTLLAQANALREEGIGRGSGMAALQQTNVARFSQIEQAGKQLATYIEQGRVAFDAVDEYAESTWTDIRGNGSEAQASATRAKQLWERAQQRNATEQQDFYGAKQDLDGAESEINRARTLIDTVIQRLKDLETSKANTQKELAMARADIDTGRKYIAENDDDVGKEPERMLDRAEELLQQAQSEAAKAKPDWIALVKLAQQANTTADEALAQAQGERVAMDKLREQMNTARQLAQGETQRLTQFVKLHNGDFSANTNAAIQRIAQLQQQADGGASLIERTEEQARADALREAQQRYTALSEEAGKVYQQALSEFETVEKIRKDVQAEAQTAAQAIANAERVMQVNSAYIPRNSEGIQLLERAHALMNNLGVVRSDAEAQQAIGNIREARRNADSAAQLFQSYGNTTIQGGNNNSGPGDFVGGVIIGSLLGGNQHHHGGGSNWGGGWGGGGGSSSGGGGGDWGGGGGGGGGWGDGGGGGGGW